MKRLLLLFPLIILLTGCSKDDEAYIGAIEFAHTSWSNPNDFNPAFHEEIDKGYMIQFTNSDFDIEYHAHDIPPLSNGFVATAIYSWGEYVYNPPILKLYTHNRYTLTYKVYKDKMVLESDNIYMANDWAIKFPDILYLMKD